MRISRSAAIFFLSLGLVAGSLAAESAAPDTQSPPVDAAAKHAKRTACLKDAKSKKLVGAEKTAFLKHCMEAP